MKKVWATRKDSLGPLLGLVLSLFPHVSKSLSYTFSKAFELKTNQYLFFSKLNSVLYQERKISVYIKGYVAGVSEVGQNHKIFYTRVIKEDYFYILQ